jgi:hypothetical protein
MYKESYNKNILELQNKSKIMILIFPDNY